MTNLYQPRHALTDLTIASVAYEASSLLSTYAHLPQPVCLTVQTHPEISPGTGGHGAISLQFDELEHVRAWAAQFSTSVIALPPIKKNDEDNHISYIANFVSQWDQRVKISASCVINP